MARRVAPTLGCLFALACLWGMLASPALAKPPFKKGLTDYLGPFLDQKLNDCRTCHVPDQPGHEGPKPHNPFGARVKEIRRERIAAGQSGDMADCLDALASEDCDGDGVTNLVELLAGHFPGDKLDQPSAEAIKSADEKLAAFREFRSIYPWKPFEAVKRPALAWLQKKDWAQNPIDAFIAAEHERRGLTPQPEAARPVLVRRVYLDLVGLPPTRDELQAALADSSADWYEKLVDRLLASPRHGERWGRHWMDVWRYSDWYGYAGEIRHSQPHIWRWRDWIIQSVGADKGYDRMIEEMLAGDELAPEDEQIVRATGFLARNFHGLPKTRDKWMQDTVEHTFQGFLGLTIGCARCHDHMYDPLTQKDFYQVRAIFEPYRVRVDWVPGGMDKPRMSMGNGFTIPGDGFVRVFDAEPTTPTYLFTRGDETMPDKSAPLPPGVPAALGGRLPEFMPVKLSRDLYDPEKRDFVYEDLLKQERQKVEAFEERLKKVEQPDARALAELDVELAKARHHALAATLRAERLEDAGQQDTEEGRQAASQAVVAQRRQSMSEARRNLYFANKELADPRYKENAIKKIEAIEKGLARLQLEDEQPPGTNYVKRAVKSYPRESTGRRLALARWIANAENPLTARVAMNHVWLRHFGQGLSLRPFDFGHSGGPPTHPALLDWLASEFMAPAQTSQSQSDGAWSMKRMHRLMVTSATYRQASTGNEANAKLDADNRHYWRTSSRRMDAEVLRDSLFHLSGSLDLTMGGPDIDHAKGNFVPRRSIYFRHAQENQMEFLKTFDSPSVIECYERVVSVVPHQALALSNSDLAIQQARLAARALQTQTGELPEAFVSGAFEQVLSRPPSDAELAECVNFLQQQAALYRPNPSAPEPADARSPSPNPQLRARENLLRILLNHNDFVTIR